MEGKQGSKDGLSKKERRALKVKAKQDNQQGEPNVNTQNSTQPPKKQENNKQQQNCKPQSKEMVENKADLKNETAQQAKAKNDEKEQRRKEWEKKMAEQKAAEAKTADIANKEGLSKTELKAKRRELQEAQRQAKQAVKVPEKQAVPPVKQKTESTETAPKKEAKKVTGVSKVQLVHHLYVEDGKKQEYDSTVNIKGVHPAFVRLGAQYAANTVLGSNARCLALLSALRQLVEDLLTPPKQEFRRYLESILQNCVVYLQSCRPLAVSMTNALRHFKLHLTKIDTNLSDNEKKAKIIDVIDTYIQDDIAKAGEAISMKVTEKICNGDVILIYGCSSLIRKILLDAHKNGKQFEIIVVDGRPLLEGREMLRRLVDAGLNCTYVMINAVSFVMSSATKVLLGAHALLANGYVMSRTGTAQIALIAKAFNKPVLVCCETYKFSEKAQTDSFVYNEIGNPDKLVTIDTLEEVSPIANWKSNSCLTPLNLLYDVTPPDLVTAVVTELGFLPCTSVPVVLRIRPVEMA